MTKKNFVQVVIFFLAICVFYPLGKNAQAALVVDYGQISPTVKVESYKLARNGDVFQANSASATIINKSGLLLTNSHVVLDDRNDPYDIFAVCLSFAETQEPACEYTAVLVAYDKNLDIALLQMVGVDNHGNALPELPFLNYNYSGVTKVGDSLNVFGFPAIGGKTLNKTNGQLSGFEERNGVQYFKTDTDFANGNSGGTAIDAKGNFVGVPTYIRSAIENIGYILDIKEAAKFIELHLNDEIVLNTSAYQALIAQKNIFNQAKDSNYYQGAYEPYFSLGIQGNWEWDSITRDGISVSSESNKNYKTIQIHVKSLPFKFTDEYIEEMMRLSGLYMEYVSNYQQESVMFAGQKAILLTYNVGGEKYYNYFIPYGHNLINIQYSAEVEDLTANLLEFDQVLNTFTFIDSAVDQPAVINNYTDHSLGFSIDQIGQWYIQPNLDAYQEDVILGLFNPKNIWGEMSLSYSEIDDDKKELSNSQYLDRLLTEYKNGKDGFELINKNDSLLLDDLSGWSITYTALGLEQDKDSKISEVYLRDGEYVYTMVYEDLIDGYNSYLQDFKNILASFKNLNKSLGVPGEGLYELGSLDYAFSDIKYHRFAQSITELADDGVIVGYTNDTFRPEKNISANEAKLFIANSFANSQRSQINPQGAKFLLGSNVSLANGLKALVDSYKLTLWNDKYNDAPNWKPYLDKGLEMELLPSELYDPQHFLTRGEFTYILKNLWDSFKVM